MILHMSMDFVYKQKFPHQLHWCALLNKLYKLNYKNNSKNYS